MQRATGVGGNGEKGEGVTGGQGRAAGEFDKGDDPKKGNSLGCVCAAQERPLAFGYSESKWNQVACILDQVEPACTKSKVLLCGGKHRKHPCGFLLFSNKQCCSLWLYKLLRGVFSIHPNQAVGGGNRPIRTRLHVGRVRRGYYVKHNGATRRTTAVVNDFRLGSRCPRGTPAERPNRTQLLHLSCRQVMCSNQICLLSSKSKLRAKQDETKLSILPRIFI